MLTGGLFIVSRKLERQLKEMWRKGFMDGTKQVLAAFNAQGLPDEVTEGMLAQAKIFLKEHT